MSVWNFTMDDNEEYEMVSGHRRMHAAQLAGLTTIPAIVRELSDEDAIVAMVDANIQREELLPSEKAFAYKIKLVRQFLLYLTVCCTKKILHG